MIGGFWWGFTFFLIREMIYLFIYLLLLVKFEKNRSKQWCFCFCCGNFTLISTSWYGILFLDLTHVYLCYCSYIYSIFSFSFFFFGEKAFPVVNQHHVPWLHFSKEFFLIRLKNIIWNSCLIRKTALVW